MLFERIHRAGTVFMLGFVLVFAVVWTVLLIRATAYYLHTKDYEGLKSWWTVGALGYPFFAIMYLFLRFMRSISNDELGRLKHKANSVKLRAD